MGRAPCCDKNGLKKGPWTPEEDQKLIDYIKQNGYGNWRTLPKNAGLQRCGKSCRLRWTNYLRPDIKRGRFSFEEEESIIQLHSILGNKWSAIAARLPGRTDNEIKNYWNTHIRKRLLRMGIDPVTHSPRLDLLDLSTILNSSLYTNPQSQMNFSRLLGMQPLINPELIRLATSLLSSQRQNQNQDFDLMQNHLISHHDNHQMFQQPGQMQNQAQDFTIPTTNFDTTTPSGPLFTSHDQVLPYPDVQHEFNDQINNLDQFDLLDNYNVAPETNYGGYYGSDPSSETSTFQCSGNNNNLSFQSVMSSNMSTPSNSTYISSNSSSNDQDESRDNSYCSNYMMKFEIPDILDVNDFM